MKKLVQDFPIQLQEALIIGQNYRFLTSEKEFSNVIDTGLGGSGASSKPLPVLCQSWSTFMKGKNPGKYLPAMRKSSRPSLS